MCHAGTRFAQATVILREVGVGDAAKLTGGMLRWGAEGDGVEGQRLGPPRSQSCFRNSITASWSSALSPGTVE